jgi:D-3-phosphoglycerate dehydrogenase
VQILFADDIRASHLQDLRQLGHEVIVEPSLGADDLVERLGGIDVLVVRSTKVTAEAIAAADRLGLIVRAGAGTDNIDIASASDHGVYVCNVPGRNAVAVAELTMGLMLAIDRQIPNSVADLRDGTWNKGRYSDADGLYGKTMAIIGLGDIGLAVAERARAFGLTVVSLRREHRSANVQARIRSIGVRLVDTIDELLAGADIVSLHVPKSPDTQGLVDADFLAKLKPGAVLLNTSRGDVVDEAALLTALDGGDLRAGLDVWPNEPGRKSGTFTSTLAAHPRVVGTHHIGASTDQAQESVAEGTVEVIEAYLQGEIVNCVNLNTKPSGTTCLTIRHLDRVGVLAQIFAVLRSHGLNVQQMQNQVFAGGRAAVATINVAGGPTSDIIEQLCEIDEVLDASLVTDQNEETQS